MLNSSSGQPVKGVKTMKCAFDEARGSDPAVGKRGDAVAVRTSEHVIIVGIQKAREFAIKLVRGRFPCFCVQRQILRIMSSALMAGWW